MNNYVIAAIIGVIIIAGIVYASQNDEVSVQEKAQMDQEAKMKMEADARAKAEMDAKADMDTDMDAKAGVMVGGAMMLPTLDIVDNAAKASNVTTVVAAVKAAGLVDTLKDLDHLPYLLQPMMRLQNCQRVPWTRSLSQT